jgi:hypothetical protein
MIESERLTVGELMQENNLFEENPAIAEELKALLISYIELRRSTPGIQSASEGMENWPQIEWMYH